MSPNGGVRGREPDEEVGPSTLSTSRPTTRTPLEIAGTVVAVVAVVAVGSEATRFRVGDAVMSLTPGGGHAELAAVHESVAMAVPSGLGWNEAGGFPEAFSTAHDALFTQCGLRHAERMLVTGAAGGVGAAAVQLGVASGVAVVASVRDPNLRADGPRSGQRPSRPMSMRRTARTT